MKVGDDVIDVLDADAKPNRLWPHAGSTLFFG
jgi:hypothetical protein